MDARIAIALMTVLISLGVKPTQAASYRTENFIVTAAEHAFAVKVANEAESLRRTLALEWLGRELPPWRDACPIRVHVGKRMGAGGATTFAFLGRQPVDWHMSIQGSAERVLDSVLPHEITHTIFATHFGQPLPRWADEGACTTVEHVSERRMQHDFLIRFLNTERGIPFNRMFAMREYPRDVMPLYSQGYSVARFLIKLGDKPNKPHSGQRQFVRFVGFGLQTGNWNQAVAKFYDYESLSDLQVKWLEWVKKGSPLNLAEMRETPKAPATQFVSAGTRESQSPASSASAREDRNVVQADASNDGTNYYVKQARLAGGASSQTSLRPKSTQSSAPSRPTGDRKILLEWRGETTGRKTYPQTSTPRTVGPMNRVLR